MRRKRQAPETTISKLRQAKVALANDAALVAQMLIERWRKHYNTEKTTFSLKRNLGFLR